MNEILGAVALVMSVIAVAGVALLLIKREDLSNVESNQRRLELEVTDLVDRLQVWQRRDASRQRRMDGATAAELGGPVADQHSIGTGRVGKDQLRAAARTRGLMP